MQIRHEESATTVLVPASYGTRFHLEINSSSFVSLTSLNVTKSR